MKSPVQCPSMGQSGMSSSVYSCTAVSTLLNLSSAPSNETSNTRISASTSGSGFEASAFAASVLASNQGCDLGIDVDIIDAVESTRRVSRNANPSRAEISSEFLRHTANGNTVLSQRGAENAELAQMDMADLVKVYLVTNLVFSSRQDAEPTLAMLFERLNPNSLRRNVVTKGPPKPTVLCFGASPGRRA